MNKNTVKIIIAACALLLVALLILQFIPFFEYEGEKVSLAQYLWLTYEYKPLTRYFDKEFDTETNLKDMMWVPLGIFVLCVVGPVLYIFNRDKLVAPVCAIICGGVTVFGFLTIPVFQTGKTWVIQVAVGALMIVVGIVAVAFKVIVTKKEKAAQEL